MWGGGGIGRSRVRAVAAASGSASAILTNQPPTADHAIAPAGCELRSKEPFANTHFSLITKHTPSYIPQLNPRRRIFKRERGILDHCTVCS